MRRDIRERAISVVVIKNAPAVSANKKVGEAVVIVITDCHTHPEQTFCADTRFRSHIGECSIAIVSVKRAAQWMCRCIDLGCRSVDEIKIEQAILVIVDPRASGPHGLDQVLLGTGRIVVNKGDSGRARDIGERDTTLLDRRPCSRQDEGCGAERRVPQEIASGEFAQKKIPQATKVSYWWNKTR